MGRIKPDAFVGQGFRRLVTLEVNFILIPAISFHSIWTLLATLIRLNGLGVLAVLYSSEHFLIVGFFTWQIDRRREPRACTVKYMRKPTTPIPRLIISRMVAHVLLIN